MESELSEELFQKLSGEPPNRFPPQGFIEQRGVVTCRNAPCLKLGVRQRKRSFSQRKSVRFFFLPVFAKVLKAVYIPIGSYKPLFSPVFGIIRAMLGAGASDSIDPIPIVRIYAGGRSGIQYRAISTSMSQLKRDFDCQGLGHNFTH